MDDNKLLTKTFVAKTKPQRTAKTPGQPTKQNASIVDAPDLFNIYILSTYYFPISESMGNNGVALILVAPTEWTKTVNGNTSKELIVRATSDSMMKMSTCNVEKTNEGGFCTLHSVFAGCFGVPNMTKFEISLGNDKFYEIPFKTVSYEKREVVTCISPLFTAEQWHQIIFAAHIYRKYGSFMHLYVRSVVAPVHELIKAYEAEGYLKAEPYPRFNYASIPKYNPNMNVAFRAQPSAQSDCLLQYKESAQWITFMDLDDILIPRAGSTYLDEFTAVAINAEFIYYVKADVYYETNADPQLFSTFDIFQSTRFLNSTRAGKVAVNPKYMNHTRIHSAENNRKHKEAKILPEQNVIVHLKKAYPLGYANEIKQLWPYFYRNGTKIFNETDIVAIEADYKRISLKYSEIWKKLPTSLTYLPLIADCFDKQYYKVWYTNPSSLTYCFNPDYCKIPNSLIAPCVNADADYFSSQDGTEINVHYPKNHRFTIHDRCVT